MTALVILLWGLAQYLLAFDDCVSLPAADRPLDVPQLAQSPGNVIDVTLNEARSELVFRLRTRNRDEFHRIAEARYAVDSFLGRVDEMWRAAGLFAPPFRVATHFPIWDERPVDSFQLAVESKPITRLLMGRALYGGRRHIWLRELLQNAHDAITMRRRDDSRYVGCVQVLRQHDHLVRVSDDGVGMTRQHVLAFLATLGRSGWRSLGRDEGREDDAPEVFGRFGIGFASVFSAASAVTVCTRRPGTRSVDGLKVSFSGADRPFFIEPAACAEGTSVDVELREPFSRDEFVEAVRNLFLYLPSEVAVTPDPEMPTSLCEASSYRPKQPEARWETVTATSEAVFGTSPARVTLELIIPELRNRQGRLERPSIYSQPATTLTFAVDGVLARTEDGLQVTKPASTWNWDTKKHLGLRGCLMTVDFERNTAPILPSRSEVDLGPEFDSAVRGLLEQRLPDLIPRLVELPSVATEHGSARNRAIVSALASLGISGEPAGGVVETEAVQSAVAEFYRAECPVAVTSTESRTWVLLDDLDPLECATVTPEKVASTAAFAVYVSPSAFSEMARSVSAPPTVRRSVRGCTEMMSGAASMRDRRGECGWAIASIESRRTMWLRRKDADDVGASADSAVTALQRFAERSLCGPAGVGPDSEVGDRHDGQPHRRPPARRYVLGVEAEHVVLDHAGRRPRRAGWRC